MTSRKPISAPRENGRLLARRDGLEATNQAMPPVTEPGPRDPTNA